MDGLAWLVNLGVVPFHVFASRAGSMDRPDWCVLDLDPKEAPFEHVIRIARALRALCEEVGLPAYPKTTGQRGMHVLLPLGGQLDHAQARTLGELLARVLEARAPGHRHHRPRHLRARWARLPGLPAEWPGQDHRRPLAVRPRPGAPVSMPLRWNEVGPRLDPARFTIRNALARMHRLGSDPLAPVLSGRSNLIAALDRLRSRLPQGAPRATP